MALQDKIVLITGASSGIGKATALLLAKNGATVLAAGLNKKGLFSLATEAPKGAGGIIPYMTDLSQLEKIDALCRKILNKFRKIDWIIHSAGVIYTDEKFGRPDWKIIQKTFTVNVFAIIYINYKLSGRLRKNGGVINISSTAGIHGNGDYPIYSASKSAVITFGMALARHFSRKPRQLSSIVVCPGPTNTPMRQRLAHDAAKHQSPEFIAAVIKNIVSGKSSYRNGDIIIAKNNQAKISERLEK